MESIKEKADRGNRGATYQYAQMIEKIDQNEANRYYKIS